ncbi:CHAT domain-containing protein [Nostoc sp. FACHB-152]|uniref:cell division protein HetF n=1 Tax=unclassified Nostoc TaxID=2593658 RepID=UPI0016878B39|nr:MULTISPECIES: cell division protein HetF [unclassified Nostoc]MBD2445812.1 CHAT domain-containing protein [Nostoc sp. FACHB-152]MBD2468013.1 CHAT domain-containing protein [Nostoc sp. FACHB-145]
MTQEFHISVTPVGQNDYLVRTEQVAPGVPLAEELVTWPVADWLAAAGHLMNDPLRSVLQGDALTQSAVGIARNSVNLVALGQQFYNALFQGTLRDSWITAQGIAQNHQQVLRLRLGLKDNRLARLPWEVMHAGDRPLATGPYVAFSRYQSGLLTTSRLPSRNVPQLPDDGIVRVLMVLASPTDQTRLGLLKQEALRLQAELRRNLSSDNNQLPEIELTLLDQPGREELTQALEQGRYEVLHYSGHSNLGVNGGEIYLVSNRTGLTETLSGDDLAGLLVNNNIQMAVFNSCWGAYTATSNTTEETGERNLTESLVRRGIKCVLAMSERIPDEVALTLTQLLYRNLSQGYPVDLCVSRVRQGLISAYGSHQTYWALPILYLQPEFDGFLSPEISTSTSTESLNEYSRSVKATSITAYSAIADDTQMSLPIEEMIPPGLDNDASDLDWLGEETWGDLVDEIEYDDPTYAEDSAIVSDLFRQIDQQKTSNHPPILEEPPLGNKESNLAARQNAGKESPLDKDSLGRNIGETPRETPGNDQQQSPNSDFASMPTAQPQFISRRHRRQILGIVGAGAIATVIGLGWWWQNRRIFTFSDIPQIPTEQAISSKSSPKINLQTSPTAIVTNTATERLSQGDLQAGLVAVEELLDRGALTSAQTALKLIPQKQGNEPSANFIKGRLAWQLIQTGDKTYSIDDVRRFWEIAVKAQPDSLLYSNALGFAYYAENNVNRANDSWFKALNLALNQQSSNSNAAIATQPPPIPHDALTPYAGLALGLYKSARNQPAAKQTQYMNEAIKLRTLVINEDPVNFQVNKLSNNWLWTEKAITDWRSLLEQKAE